MHILLIQKLRGRAFLIYINNNRLETGLDLLLFVFLNSTFHVEYFIFRKKEHLRRIISTHMKYLKLLLISLI